MKEVDARGLSCPLPLMLTQKALKENGEIKVIVSEPHQKDTIEQYAKKIQKSVVVKPIGLEFEIIIN